VILDNGAEVIVGLEVHVELGTRTKLFCGCATTFGAPPNTNVCPVCLGLPGVLPRLNREVVRLATRAGLALSCTINRESRFDRKNYFYPDLPKGYQITQYERPIAEWGHLDVPLGDGEDRHVVIRRIHIEEEAGKLMHEGASLWQATGSLVDLNRAGLPLIEIVTEPDLRSPEEARLFLRELVSVLSYLDVSDLRMEEGSIRCDANLSLCPPGFQGPLESLPRVEVKNVNSIRNVVAALESEVERQRRILDSGGRVERETRGFDESTGGTLPQRSKEQANDYRYFPEPDLPPLVLDPAQVDQERRRLPELPRALRARFQAWGISAHDAAVVAQDPGSSGYLVALAVARVDPRVAVTWMLGDLARLLNEAHLGYGESPVTPAGLAELLALIENGTLSGRMAKQVLEEMFRSHKSAAEVVEASGLSQISDQDVLAAEVARAIEQNPAAVQDYQAGKKPALGFLVGQVMKATRGQASPDVVNRLLREQLAAQET
jgi:aspartyl-tRNA(Asn)/glutamyl-tRNA(Gln) amidotransferase subunit B